MTSYNSISQATPLCKFAFCKSFLADKIKKRFFKDIIKFKIKLNSI